MPGGAGCGRRLEDVCDDEVSPALPEDDEERRETRRGAAVWVTAAVAIILYTHQLIGVQRRRLPKEAARSSMRGTRTFVPWLRYVRQPSSIKTPDGPRGYRKRRGQNRVWAQNSLCGVAVNSRQRAVLAFNGGWHPPLSQRAVVCRGCGRVWRAVGWVRRRCARDAGMCVCAVLRCAPTVRFIRPRTRANLLSRKAG